MHILSYAGEEYFSANMDNGNAQFLMHKTVISRKNIFICPYHAMFVIIG